MTDPAPGTRKALASKHTQDGAVLPVAMILLIVVTFAGLSSAKRATTHEVIAQNLRISEVAQQNAEAALRHCEAVVMDLVDNSGTTFPADAARVGNTAIAAPEDQAALWLQPASWAAASTNLIHAPLVYSANVRSESQGAPPPQCIAEPMTDNRYLVTARGHSADATFEANGRLITGAEVWLQSILSPQIPVQSPGGGLA
jgi:Tfp pilus assembly protein PilX